MGLLMRTHKIINKSYEYINEYLKIYGKFYTIFSLRFLLRVTFTFVVTLRCLTDYVTLRYVRVSVARTHARSPRQTGDGVRGRRD